MFTFVLLLSALSAHAVPQKIAATGGTVEILAVGKPSFIKIQGKGDAPSGQLTSENSVINGKFEFSLDSLDTGIKLRNEHMKMKYLETDKHPKALLEIQNLSVKKDWSVKAPSLEATSFSGRMTLHGVVRPVTGTFTINSKGEVSAETKIKISEFKIAIPSYMGITVADEVQVKVKIDKLQVSL